jgi:hypothetical protein
MSKLNLKQMDARDVELEAPQRREGERDLYTTTPSERPC